ncbi:MAG TPA: pirin family protein [Nannocystaceae bacterium]|nr:pirin family protein [Nannocystaceae bacterium]
MFSRRSVLGGLATPLLVGCRGKAAAPSRREDDLCVVTQRIRATPAIDGAGAHVLRVFPGPALRHLDPFVLLDDFDVAVPAGFPEHPHRGFEAFTYMLEGEFEHADSMGNRSAIAAGGTQRFNSGAGARHSEMPGSGPHNRGLQLWVNLPRELKTMTPEYDGIDAIDMPVDERDGQRIRTVVGASSPVRLHTEVEYLDVELLAAGGFAREIDGEEHVLVYVIAGSLAIGDERAERGEALVLGPGRLDLHADAGTRFAYLRGRPHREPIRHRGPFVD